MDLVPHQWSPSRIGSDYIGNPGGSPPTGADYSRCWHHAQAGGAMAPAVTPGQAGHQRRLSSCVPAFPMHGWVSSAAAHLPQTHTTGYSGCASPCWVWARPALRIYFKFLRIWPQRCQTPAASSGRPIPAPPSCSSSSPPGCNGS